MKTLDGVRAYQDLLFRKDAAKKEAEEIRLEYTRTFASVLQDLAEVQFQCLLRKHAISLCTMSRNRQERVDVKSVRSSLLSARQTLQKDLDSYVTYVQMTVDAPAVSYADLAKIRTIYRRIARLVHPDLHPEIWEIAEIADLWDKVCSAYEGNRLAELQEAEMQIMALIPEQSAAVVIDDIDSKMEKVRIDIEQILTSEPYIWRRWLLEPDKSSRLAELNKEIEEDRAYISQLDTLLEKTFGLAWEELCPVN